jgi:hypothetical protein
MIVFCGKCFAALWLGSVAIHRKTQLQNFSLYRHGAGTGGRRSVPTTITRMTASITAYSAMSCPVSAAQSLCNSVPMLHLPAFLRATKGKKNNDAQTTNESDR